ncbi:MAG: efflux RND transporter periplasmic adaptor subunit [Sedimentisphaeraceae bacterium JB056]
MTNNKIAKVSIGAIVLLLVIAGITFYYWKAHHEPPAQPFQMPAPAVTVDKPIIKTVDQYYDFTGNVEAVSTVEIRARIEGLIEDINFTDGSFIEKDQLLFTIESDQYEAKVNEANAKVLSAKAELESAQADLERVEKAVKSNAVSLEEVSRRKAQKNIAQANLEEAQAALENAKIELNYTKIYSPISGRISKRLIDKGNLVGAGEYTLLTTVVSIDPVYVTFEMSENVLAEYLLTNNNVKKCNPESNIFVAAPAENKYTHKGVVDYIDNRVNRQTGTIELRATVENNDHILYPGMFTRVRMPGKSIKDAVLVEESAIGTNLGGKYILVVDKDNIVSTRYVEPGLSYENLKVINSGLEREEKYVTRGLQKARPGKPITPMPPAKDSGQEISQPEDENRSN